MDLSEGLRALVSATSDSSADVPEAHPAVIIGAGPAGLSAAYELARSGVSSVVLEKDAVVGGLSRTSEYKGYLFDIGGHRFFTRAPLVEQMWHEVLGGRFLTRPRLSRIYYRNRFFRYPLEPFDALRGLGLAESLRCMASYVAAQAFPRKPEEDLETWVSNRFGRRLFEIFFRSYTEKVWGISCREIRADWAAQRIRGLSLAAVIRNALTPKRSESNDKVIKTLIHEFQYPERGPGMMWSAVRDAVEQSGSKVVLNAPVQKVCWEPGRVTAVFAGGKRYEGGHFISSMPIRELISCLDPPPPGYLQSAAADFHYRDFLTVALIVRGRDLFPDNWIYIHEPEVRVGRVQNYKNWSPVMVPDPENTCLGLEYFCFEGDDLWTMPDRDLIGLGRREMAKLGIAPFESFVDGTVLRIPKAYPVYDGSYQRGLEAVRRFLETVPNLQLAGRNGMHRYNNQDHSMLTAIFAARNVLGARYDLWKVNADAQYHEDDVPGDEPGLDAARPRAEARSVHLR